jgi:hypothetical protein
MEQSEPVQPSISNQELSKEERELVELMAQITVDNVLKQLEKLKGESVKKGGHSIPFQSV